MVLVERINGEYVVKMPLDLFSLSVLLSLTRNDSFKSFVLVGYKSANVKWFDFLNVEYKKIGEEVYLVPGSAVSLIAKDTVKSGKILLCSEEYRSLSSRISARIRDDIEQLKVKKELRVSSIASLAVELTVWISDREVVFSFRDKRFVYVILAFYVYRSLSLIPTELQIEELSLVLSEVSVGDKVAFSFTKLGKCLLPGRVILSLEIIGDGKVQYLTLKYAKRKWSIRPNNSSKGALNFLHGFFLRVYDEISRLFEKYIYSRFYSFIDGLVKNVLSFLNVYWVKDLIILFFIFAVAYFMLKSKVVFLLVFIYLVWVFYKKLVVFILFKG